MKILTPVGTAISIDAYMKNNCPVTGMPVVNMWCAQTMNDRIAMDAVAYTIDVYANSFFRAKVETIALMIPKAGKIMM